MATKNSIIDSLYAVTPDAGVSYITQEGHIASLESINLWSAHDLYDRKTDAKEFLKRMQSNYENLTIISISFSIKIK